MLWEVTLLILLGTCSSGLRALEKPLLAQSSPVANTPLSQGVPLLALAHQSLFRHPKKEKRLLGPAGHPVGSQPGEQRRGWTSLQEPRQPLWELPGEVRQS